MADVDMATLVLLVLAAVGVVLHLLAIPDIAWWAVDSSDGTLSGDARVYALGLTVRSVLRIVTKISIVASGVLVLLRANGVIVEPVGDYISILAIVAVAALDIETIIDLAARRYLIIRTK